MSKIALPMAVPSQVGAETASMAASESEGKLGGESSGQTFSSFMAANQVNPGKSGIANNQPGANAQPGITAQPNLNAQTGGQSNLASAIIAGQESDETGLQSSASTGTLTATVAKPLINTAQLVSAEKEEKETPVSGLETSIRAAAAPVATPAVSVTPAAPATPVTSAMRAALATNAAAAVVVSVPVVQSPCAKANVAATNSKTPAANLPATSSPVVSTPVATAAVTTSLTAIISPEPRVDLAPVASSSLLPKLQVFSGQQKVAAVAPRALPAPLLKKSTDKTGSSPKPAAQDQQSANLAGAMAVTAVAPLPQPVSKTIPVPSSPAPVIVNPGPAVTVAATPATPSQAAPLATPQETVLAAQTVQQSAPVIAEQAAAAASTSPVAVPSKAVPGRPTTGKGQAIIAEGRGSSMSRQQASVNSPSLTTGEVVLSRAVNSLGTANAMQKTAMANNDQQQENGGTFQVVSSITAAASRATVPAAPAPGKIIPIRQEQDARQTTSSAPAPAAQSNIVSISSASSFAQKSVTPAATAEAPQQVAATNVLHKVLEAADQIRSNGDNHVEVQMKLDDGQQLTVRLQMSQGSVRPVFKTESPELRQAIEQNWAGFRSSASDRGLQISNPVFESPSAGSGFNAFANRDQSQPNGGEPQNDFEVIESPSASAKPATSTSKTPETAAATPAGVVQMYA